jgi:hypothetical protein
MYPQSLQTHSPCQYLESSIEVDELFLFPKTFNAVEVTGTGDETNAGANESFTGFRPPVRIIVGRECATENPCAPCNVTRNDKIETRDFHILGPLRSLGSMMISRAIFDATISHKAGF